MDRIAFPFFKPRKTIAIELKTGCPFLRTGANNGLIGPGSRARLKVPCPRISFRISGTG